MRTRIAAVLVSAIVATGVLVGQGSAYAANLGTVKLPARSGSVTASPIMAAATSSAACPRGFGENAALRVGRPGGPYGNIATPGRAGGYDAGPVTLRPNRSFTAALGGPPGDGEWWVVVECYSLSQGRHPDRFVTPIWVVGGAWRDTPPAGGAALAATPGTTAQQRLGVTVTPSGPSASQTPSASASPSPSTPAAGGSDGGGFLPKTGVQILLVILAGLALIAAGTGTVYMVRRRRTHLGSTGATG